MANVDAQVEETKFSSPIERKNRVDLDNAAASIGLGTLVGRDSTGYYTKADDTQKLTEVGVNVSPTQKVDSSLADGTHKCDIVSGVVAAFKIATMTDAATARSYYGRPVYALYNDEVSLSSGAQGNFVGTLIGHKSVTVALILIPAAVPVYTSLAQQDDDIENRFLHVERFVRLPGLGATTQASASPDQGVQNVHYDVAGTNATSALATFLAGGGVTLTTAGAAADEMILEPATNAKQSALDDITWDPDDELHFEVLLITGANITGTVIWAGLKLTNAEAIATDADQCYFRYDDAVDVYWHANDETGGVGNDDATDVTVVLSTIYRLTIIVDSSRVPRYYINGILKKTGVALTAGVSLKPFVGVHAVAAAAKAISLRYSIVSKRYA